MARQSSGPITGLLIGGLILAGGYFLTYRVGKPIRQKAAVSIACPPRMGGSPHREKVSGTFFRCDVLLLRRA